MSRYWREVEGEGIGDARLVGGRWVDGPFEGVLIEDREAAVQRMVAADARVSSTPGVRMVQLAALLRAALGEDTT